MDELTTNDRQSNERQSVQYLLAHELIQKYLDDAASLEELVKLNSLLVESPMAAKAFAAATRLEASLDEHFSTQPKSSQAAELLAAAIPRAAPIDNNLASLFDAPHHSFSPGWLAATSLALLALFAVILLFRGGNDIAEHPTTQPYSVVSGNVVIDTQPRHTLPEAVEFLASKNGATVQLRDGSRANFAPATRAVVVRDAGHARQVVELRDGRASFEVTPGSGEFRVETPVGNVTALGTNFSVELQSRPAHKPKPGASVMRTQLWSSLVVAVASGMVQVEVGGKAVLLGAGQSQVFAADGENEKPRGEAEKSRRDGEEKREGERKGRPGRPDGYAIVKTVDVGRNGLVVTMKASEGRLGEEKTFELAKDAEIIVDEQPAKLADLKEGITIALMLNKEQTVATAIRAEGVLRRGWIASVDAKGNSLSLKGENQNQTVAVSSDARVFVDGESRKLADVRPNEQVALRMAAGDDNLIVMITQGQAKKIRRPLAIREGRIAGRLMGIDAAKGTLLLAQGEDEEGGGEHEVTVSPETKITAGDRVFKLAELAKGVAVQIKLAAGDGKRAEAIDIQLPVLQGTLMKLDTAAGTVTLHGGEGEDRVFTLDKAAEITVDGKPADAFTLNAADRVTLKLLPDGKTVISISRGEKKKKEGER